jgi:hypothetical protein
MYNRDRPRASQPAAVETGFGIGSKGRFLVSLSVRHPLLHLRVRFTAPGAMSRPPGGRAGRSGRPCKETCGTASAPSASRADTARQFCPASQRRHRLRSSARRNHLGFGCGTSTRRSTAGWFSRRGSGQPPATTMRASGTPRRSPSSAGVVITRSPRRPVSTTRNVSRSAIGAGL